MTQSLKKNSLITLSGQLFKTAFQGLAFIIIARTLGATDFGILISILALCSIISPFVDFGSYHLIIKRISQGEKFSLVANESILLLAIVAPLFIVLLSVLTIALYGYSIYLIIIVGLTALFSDKLLSLFIALNVARDTFKVIAYTETFVSGLRLLFSLILLYLDGGVTAWASLLCLHGIITTFVVFFLLKRDMKFTLAQKPTKKLVKDGMPFVWSQVGLNANQDFDKLFLTKISGAEVAGIYAAAMRVLNLAVIPLQSFYMAAYSRYFKAATNGTDGFKHALSLLFPSAIIGLITATIIYLVAPYVPYLLGDEYEATVELIQLAALLPIIQTLSTPFADTLSGYGKQKLRVYILFAALILNVILNIQLIPAYGAYGALVASILSQTLFFFGCFGFTLRSSKWK